MMDGAPDFDVNTAIGCNLVCEMMLINDLLWDVFHGHFHAFEPVKSCVQAHIQNVCCQTASIPCGECMFPVKLDCFDASSVSGDNSWTISDEVTTDSDLCPFGFFLLWSDGADNAREGDCPALGDLVLVNEEDGVGSFDSVSNALGQVSKFIGCRSEPIVSAVWVLDWISVFHLFASDVMCDRKTTVLGQFAGSALWAGNAMAWVNPFVNSAG